MIDFRLEDHVRTTDLITLAYSVCLEAKRELHDAWIAQSIKLSEIAGAAHIVNCQDNGRLDLLIRQLDEESKSGPAPGREIDFSLTIRFSLSECWVLRAYEVVRCAADQLKNGAENAKLSELKQRLGLVRMPIAKAEIQQPKKAKEPIILAHADGSNPKDYANDGSYVVPRGICSDTGCAVWLPTDALTLQTIHIRRIDLSNELLTLFDTHTP